MRICELLLKNFGKFSDREILFSEGIQILYGENESGKSTVHTFIKGMLFGMERGRGRAANSDAFSRYEPWENPNYYAGKLLFETGGRHFIIERSFDKYSKKARLVCQEDAEGLSVEDGDLEMLLDGLSAQRYDNTVSIAQMKAQPGISLATELKDYAANYYATGDSGLNLSGALQVLKEGKKEADRAIRDMIKEKQEKRERLEQELSYIWRDIHRMEEEQERLRKEISTRKVRMEQKKQEEPEVKQRVIDKIRPGKWRIHPLEILVFAVALIGCFLFVPELFKGFVTIVMFLCGTIYIWNRMKIAKKQVKTEPERILEALTPEEEKIPLEKLLWEYGHNAEELREKQVQYENLGEELEELDEFSEEHKEYEKKRHAIQLAADRLEELSGAFQKRLKADLDTRISQIISEITEGRYTRLVLEEGLELSLLSEGRKIPAGQLSRGTIEQSYFALRMAAGELMHTEEFPVILDDAFLTYDDRRLSQALQWLHKNKRQVLLFTCQKREETLLEQLNIPYTAINI